MGNNFYCFRGIFYPAPTNAEVTNLANEKCYNVTFIFEWTFCDNDKFDNTFETVLNNGYSFRLFSPEFPNYETDSQTSLNAV